MTISKELSTLETEMLELKGVLESLLALFAVPTPTFTPAAPAPFEAGRTAAIALDGKPVGHVGQLALAEAARRKLRQPVYLAELDLATLLTYPLRQAVAHELSRFQAVERDFSFVFPDSLTWETTLKSLRALNIEEIQQLHPVEIWRNREKFPGVYSALIRITFQSLDHTLTDTELTGWWSSIIATLQGLGGTLRDH